MYIFKKKLDFKGKSPKMRYFYLSEKRDSIHNNHAMTIIGVLNWYCPNVFFVNVPLWPYKKIAGFL